MREFFLFSLDRPASIRIFQALKSSLKIFFKPLQEKLTTPGSAPGDFPLAQLAWRKYKGGLRNQ